MSAEFAPTQAQPATQLSILPTNQPLALDTLEPKSMAELQQLAEVFAKSGFFADAKDAAKACVKILAGRELGLPPIASMKGFHIIQGAVSMGSNLMAALVKKSGRYDFRVVEITDQVCRIQFLQRAGASWEEIGVSEFTMEDARKAGTQNTNKYPRNMLYARAMSNGCRWYVSDVFAGMTVYTPDELGVTVNEHGEIEQARSKMPPAKRVESRVSEPRPQMTPDERSARLTAARDAWAAMCNERDIALDDDTQAETLTGLLTRAYQATDPNHKGMKVSPKSVDGLQAMHFEMACAQLATEEEAGPNLALSTFDPEGEG